MEDVINLKITPLQILLTMAFQLWIVLFPLLIIKKINNLTSLLQEFLDSHNDKM